MKSGFIAILGQPNVGKSTFVNALLSKRVSIVSPKPQTTRDNIDAVFQRKDAQLVFIDTPGLFESEGSLDKFMNKEARSSLSGADAALFIVSAENLDTSKDDKILSSLKLNCPLFIVINKIDLAIAPDMERLLKHYISNYPEATVLQMSAITNFGLKEVRDAVSKVVPEGPAYFGEGVYTDKDSLFMAKEMIRSEILHFLKDEVPHQSAVTIDSFKESKDIVKIQASIYVEKEGQVAIVIGKGGEMIKRISMTARRNLQKEWKKRVELIIQVRHEPNWRNKPDKLRSFGYSDEENERN